MGASRRAFTALLGSTRPMHKLLPSPDGDSTQARAEEEQSRRFGGRNTFNVYRPSEATAARLPAEYVGDEEVPIGIRGFQLSNRRIGNGERERRHCWSGSPVAIRSDRAFDLGGPSPGAVGHDRR